MGSIHPDYIIRFCTHIAQGRHAEAQTMLSALPKPDKASGVLVAALDAMLGSVYDRETQLAEMVAELAVLRQEQEQDEHVRLAVENNTLRKAVDKKGPIKGIVGQSEAIQNILACVEKVANVPVTVLITGETGTGKGFIAQHLHYSSVRAKRPFVNLNCAAIPESLLESELFGIEKGVASGVDARIGHFEQAHEGTLFLDEIGDMPMNCQTKILKALESGSITRVGGRKPVPVNVRLVAATHRDLEESCNNGSFRRDLIYRLNVIHLHMPALRERPGDITLLARHFLRAACVRYNISGRSFAPDVLTTFEQYPWPGNVRELEHEVERDILLAPSSVIHLEDISARFTALHPAPAPRQEAVAITPPAARASALSGNLQRLSTHPDLLERVRRQIHERHAARFATGASTAHQPRYLAGEEAPSLLHDTSAVPSLNDAASNLIRQALEQCGNNKSMAAKMLGISREGLRKKMKRLGLESFTPQEQSGAA